jgi:predicted nucleic acid-binding protein
MARFPSLERKFMSGDRTSVDTNVLVYAYDTSAGLKRRKAQKIIADLWHSGLGVVSTQILQEFFVTVTRKLPKAMEPDVARDVVGDLLKWDLVVIEGSIILDAIDLHGNHGYSFWDSLTVAAAAKAGCTLLLSKDLASGQNIEGVTIKNPFD